jgi:large subunit ribosomal protein L10
MSKLVKQLIADELTQRYGGTDSALWIELIGVNGLATNQLRRELRAKQMRLEIVKNSLFKRAVANTPLRALGEALDGPAALVTGGTSLVDVAKVIEEWLPKIKGLKLRGAVIEGEWLDQSRVSGLSRMPTRKDMLARVVSAALSPGGNLAAILIGGGSQVAGCLKSLIEKLEKQAAEAPQEAPQEAPSAA